MILPFSSPNLKKLVLQSAIGVSEVGVWVGVRYRNLLLEVERVEEEERRASFSEEEEEEKY